MAFNPHDGQTVGVVEPQTMRLDLPPEGLVLHMSRAFALEKRKPMGGGKR